MTVVISILSRPTPEGFTHRVKLTRKARCARNGPRLFRSHADAFAFARRVVDLSGKPPAQILTLEPAARYLARHPEIEAPAN